MVDRMLGIVEEDASKFRNVIPEAKAWKVGTDDALWRGFLV